MAKPRFSRFDCAPGCSVEAAIGLIDGKWKSVILYHLMTQGVMRFGALGRVVKATPRMLTNQLRELEEDGLITRTVFAQVPPRVDYALSPLGESMAPVLQALKLWGDANIGLYGKPKPAAPEAA